MSDLRRNATFRNAAWQCITDPALLALAADRLESLAKAVIELSDSVGDRDGLSDAAEITVDTARGILDPNWLNG